MYLYIRILQDNSFQHVVSWTPRGDAFVVKNVTEFSRTVLPRIYKHHNFSSFVRQLNKYDFHKVSAKEGAEDTDNVRSSTFRHPDFRSDELGALHKIKRKVTVRRSVVSGFETSASLTGPFDLESQVQEIADTQRAMSAHIQNLEKNYHDVLEELIGLQQRMANQDRLTQTLIRYIVQAGQTQALSSANTISSIHSGGSDSDASGSNLLWSVSDYSATSSTAHQVGHEMVMPSAPLQDNTIVTVSPHVLVVDDDNVTRAVIGRLLQTLRCAFDIAIDGAEAVQKMAEEQYDIVLMDIVMPNMDGVSASRIIRRSNHRTPIIAMTSFAQEEAVATYYAAGMNDVLKKPFNMAGLRSLMERHLGRAHESQ
ncbi:CheY-like superfamily [Mucidula mucida]|nr:CheY-like superfamily [Mucidula mucida]